MILGILCIFLIKLFPTPKELEKIDLNFIDDEILQMKSFNIFFILMKG